MITPITDPSIETPFCAAAVGKAAARVPDLVRRAADRSHFEHRCAVPQTLALALSVPLPVRPRVIVRRLVDAMSQGGNSPGKRCQLGNVSSSRSSKMRSSMRCKLSCPHLTVRARVHAWALLSCPLAVCVGLA